MGAIADYLDVQAGYERAGGAGLGDLLQYVIVERPQQAMAGFQLVRERSAGRCGFLIASVVAPAEAGAYQAVVDSVAYAASGFGAAASSTKGVVPADGLVALSSVVKVNGPHAAAIRQAIGDAWI